MNLDPTNFAYFELLCEIWAKLAEAELNEDYIDTALGFSDPNKSNEESKMAYGDKHKYKKKADQLNNAKLAIIGKKNIV